MRNLSDCKIYKAVKEGIFVDEGALYEVHISSKGVKLIKINKATSDFDAVNVSKIMLNECIKEGTLVEV